MLLLFVFHLGTYPFVFVNCSSPLVSESKKIHSSGAIVELDQDEVIDFDVSCFALYFLMFLSFCYLVILLFFLFLSFLCMFIIIIFLCMFLIFFSKAVHSSADQTAGKSSEAGSSRKRTKPDSSAQPGTSSKSGTGSEGSHGSGGSGGSRGASNGGQGGDDPNRRKPDRIGKPPSDEEEEETDEEEEEEILEADTGAVAGAAAGGAAGGAAGAAAVADQGNWLSFHSLMNETFPVKSKTCYLAAYSDFEKFLKKENKFRADVAPSEVCLLNYFYYLKTVKFFAPTTIWSVYSRINAVFKRRFAISLNSYASISDLLKSYSAGHNVKKSCVFSPQQAN